MKPTVDPSKSAHAATDKSQGASGATGQRHHDQDWFEELKADMLPMIKFTVSMMKSALKDAFQHKLSQAQQAKIMALLDKLPETGCAFLKDFFAEDQANSAAATTPVATPATATSATHHTTTKRATPARQAPAKSQAKGTPKPATAPAQPRRTSKARPKSKATSKSKITAQTIKAKARAKTKTSQAKTTGSAARTQRRSKSS